MNAKRAVKRTKKGQLVNKINLFQNKSLVKEVAKQILPHNKKYNVAVMYPCDLRASVQMKLEECSPFATWTAFVNRTGHLVHIVNKNTGDMLRKAVKGYTIRYKTIKQMGDYAAEVLRANFPPVRTPTLENMEMWVKDNKNAILHLLEANK